MVIREDGDESLELVAVVVYCLESQSDTTQSIATTIQSQLLNIV